MFIGVVSHPRSSFTVNQGSGGLAPLLAAEIRKYDWECLFSLNLINEFDVTGAELEASAFRKGIAEEVRLERVWNRFLGVEPALRRRLFRLLRWMRLQSLWVRRSNAKEVRRLRNIELSHLSLMRNGLAQGADWILILEDDASAKNIADLAAGLDGIFSCESPPAFVNLSHSFRLSDLGISKLLFTHPVVRWFGPIPRDVLASRLPATNTVCAILYRRGFLENLVRKIDEIPVYPIVPIDWRVNQALMNLCETGHINSGDCWFVEPAPINQLSMHQ